MLSEERTRLLGILLVLSTTILGCGILSTPTPTPIPTTIPMVSPSSTSTPALTSGWTSYTNANYVQAIAFDGSGNLWAVGYGGVVRWDVGKNTYTKYTVDDGLADNDVFSIAVDPDGALWFGTLGGGVSHFRDAVWTTYSTDNGLVDNDVLSIAIGPGGELWFGTYRGVSRYVPPE